MSFVHYITMSLSSVFTPVCETIGGSFCCLCRKVYGKFCRPNVINRVQILPVLCQTKQKKDTILSEYALLRDKRWWVGNKWDMCYKKVFGSSKIIEGDLDVSSCMLIEKDHIITVSFLAAIWNLLVTSYYWTKVFIFLSCVMSWKKRSHLKDCKEFLSHRRLVTGIESIKLGIVLLC